MISPLSLRSLSLRCGSPSFEESTVTEGRVGGVSASTQDITTTVQDITPTVQDITPTVQDIIPTAYDVIPSTKQDLSEAIKEALSGSDDEFGEDWVVENRPQSFID